ncbi:hypothetical protein BJ165DRAFT_1410956 [Panaeolus papilionaceus]|nr:hypothetical protein BJ165DRAFT_1410956 [Panaeolus papilionaceus]
MKTAPTSLLVGYDVIAQIFNLGSPTFQLAYWDPQAQKVQIYGESPTIEMFHITLARCGHTDTNAAETLHSLQAYITRDVLQKQEWRDRKKQRSASNLTGAQKFKHELQSMDATTTLTNACANRNRKCKNKKNTQASGSKSSRDDTMDAEGEVDTGSGDAGGSATA